MLPYYVRIRLIELQDAVFGLRPFATGIKLHSEGRGSGARQKSAAGEGKKTNCGAESLNLGFHKNNYNCGKVTNIDCILKKTI